MLLGKWFTDAFAALCRRYSSAFYLADVLGACTMFESIPALTTLAAGKDPYLVYVEAGGTAIVTRNTDGTISFKTQTGGAAADGDRVLWKPGATTNRFAFTLTAGKAREFTFKFRIETITTCMFFIGLNTNVTAVDPTATANEGAGLFFIPAAVTAASEMTDAAGLAAITAAQRGNFLAAFKTAGADTFTNTGVAVVAATDYTATIRIGTDLVPHIFINGVKVASAAALTAGQTLSLIGGIEATAVPVAAKEFAAWFAKVA